VRIKWVAGLVRPSGLSSGKDLRSRADGCKDFAELRALIVQARATAMNDADRRRARLSTSNPTS
jgi:hypothetical protein